MLFVETTLQPRAEDAAKIRGWKALVEAGEWRRVAGDRLRLFVSPAVERMAAVVRQALDRPL